LWKKPLSSYQTCLRLFSRSRAGEDVLNVNSLSERSGQKKRMTIDEREKPGREDKGHLGPEPYRKRPESLASFDTH